PLERTKRERAPQSIIGERNQAKRAEHNPRTRRRDGAVLLVRIRFGGRGGQGRRPRIERERHDPDDVVDEPRAVYALPDFRVRDTQDDEVDEQSDRQAPIRAAPNLLARDEGRDDHAGHGRHEERRHPEGEEQMRVAVQQPAADQIKNGIDDAARKPGHRVYFRLLQRSSAGSRYARSVAIETLFLDAGGVLVFPNW